jgi:outer membrane protein assembly factor BamA
VLTLQPSVFFTTRGRKSLTFFMDAPGLLSGGWRVDFYVGWDKQVATPYYGLGNASVYDEALEADDGPNPYYYRFGRDRRGARVNVQRDLGSSPLRLLVGAAVSRAVVDPVPYDEGTTLLATELGLGPSEGPRTWSNSVRLGLVWDTRDREVGPRRGVWSDVLVQRVAEALGSDVGYTRWTVTDRRYFPLGSERLVLANRFLLQGVQGDAPVQDLFTVQTSFKQREGLGGAETLRGVLKNRLVGRGLFLWNAELRWQALDLEVLGRSTHVVLNAFLDSGRVWAENVQLGDAWKDLSHGWGGGVRIGFGESFVAGVDVGHSDEATAQLYIGSGYLY